MSAVASSSVIGSSEIADHASRPGRSSSACRNGLRGRFFAAEAQHREHGRRARRPKQLLEQDGAVRVGPLQVVDADDQRPAIRQPAQQLAQRLECPAPKTERIDAPGLLIPARVRDGVHLQQHREHSRQRRHIGRQQPSRPAGAESTRDSGSGRRRRRRAPCNGTDSFS